MPRLRDNGSTIEFAASGKAVLSAGPNLHQAETHVVEGKFGSPRVTLQLGSPPGTKAAAMYAAAHVASGNPPRSDVTYAIDLSSDGGKSWQRLVDNWKVNRQGEEPGDFWSQSFCWVSKELTGGMDFRVRFRNSGGRNYLRAEAHLVYQVPNQDKTQVTFAWADNRGRHEATHVVTGAEDSWRILTGSQVQTHWVEFKIPASLPR
jgi:hypothetical protein